MIYIQTDKKFEDFKDLLLNGAFTLTSGKCCTTFKNEECEIIEETPKRRTFYAIVELCKTYFSEVTKGEIADFLINSSEFITFICKDIGKFVFIRNMNPLKTDTIRSYLYYGIPVTKKDLVDLSLVDLITMAEEYNKSKNQNI